MGLKNTRAGNYPEWYQNVVSEADMAENSSSPGCMVIKPWGYGIWERIRDVFDEKIKETEHENCYFPMFIPLSFFQKEAEHVDGFAKEMAVVTHSRLSMKDGKLTPDSKLEEPLIVRPTSEAIIADSFSKWVKSYRDLPVLVNQWGQRGTLGNASPPVFENARVPLAGRAYGSCQRRRSRRGNQAHVGGLLRFVRKHAGNAGAGRPQAGT